MTQTVRLDAELAPARVPHERRLARAAYAAQGLLPARRPRSECDLRDGVRLRRAADALLDELRPGALRGARPPVGRPVRARLRRRAAHRLEVRLQLLRRRASDQPAPVADEPRSRGRSGTARVRLRDRPARRRLARGGDRRRGARVSTRRCAGRRWIARGSLAAVDDPNLVLDTIKRAEDSDALVLRLYEAHGARGTARISARLAVFGRQPARTRSRKRKASELDVEDGAIVLAYRPHEVVTVVVR